MHAPGCRAGLALLALLTAVTGFLPGARAQDYPNQPVRLMTDSAPGSAIDHLTGELLQQQANIKLLMVPYTGGTPQIINDMMGNHILASASI